MKTPLIILILGTFILTTLGPFPGLANSLILPLPGTMVKVSPAYNPAVLKGIKVQANNPFRIEFILDKGDNSHPEGAKATEGSQKQDSSPSAQNDYLRLIKYFLAALTVPESDLWVNLSPYEKDRIIPDAFGQTEMGRDLLAQDYILKQLTASLMYPEDEVGKKFWKRVYEESARKFGNTNIPVNTFNKVWIVPEKAVVYENAKNGTAFVVESKLKVMLEEDYLAIQTNHRQPGDMTLVVSPSRLPSKRGLNTKAPQVSTVTQTIISEVVIPQLYKEINQGQNFAQLRQVYNSLILATWYKKKLKNSILAQVYADKNKVSGISHSERSEESQKQDPSPAAQDDTNVETIYQNYLHSFKKGAYNFIKEEIDPASHKPIPRKYFSGGFSINGFAADLAMVDLIDQASLMGQNAVSIIADMSMLSHATEHGQNITLEGGVILRTSLNTEDLEKIMSENDQWQVEYDNSGRSMLTQVKKRWGVSLTSFKAVDNIFGLKSKILKIHEENVKKGIIRPVVIMDWGVGEGWAAEELSYELDDLGIDHRIIGISKDYYSSWEKHSGKIEFILDDALKLNRYIPEESVDIIYSHLGLSHVIFDSGYGGKMSEDVLKEYMLGLKRMLRPGGILDVYGFVPETDNGRIQMGGLEFELKPAREGAYYAEFIRDQAQSVDLKSDKIKRFDDESLMRTVIKKYPKDVLYMQAMENAIAYVLSTKDRGYDVTFHNAFHWNELLEFYDHFVRRLRGAGAIENPTIIDTLYRIAVLYHDLGYYARQKPQRKHNSGWLSVGHEDVSKMIFARFHPDMERLQRQAVDFFIDHTKLYFDKEWNDMHIRDPKKRAAVTDIDQLMVLEAHVLDQIRLVKANASAVISPEAEGFLNTHFKGWDKGDVDFLIEVLLAARLMAVADIYGHSSNMISLIPGLWEEFRIDKSPALQPTALSQIVRTWEIFNINGGFYKHRIRHLAKGLDIKFFPTTQRNANLNKIKMGLIEPLDRIKADCRLDRTPDPKDILTVKEFIQGMRLRSPEGPTMRLPNDMIQKMYKELTLMVVEWMNPDLYFKSLHKGDLEILLQHGLTYEQTKTWHLLKTGLDINLPSGFWKSSESVKNYFLVSLDSIEGFKVLRDEFNKEDISDERKSQLIGQMADLYRAHVLGARPSNTGSGLGQYDFLNKHGLLWALKDRNILNPLMLLRMAFPELVYPQPAGIKEYPNALKEQEVSLKFWSDEQKVKEEILRVLNALDGFEAAYQQYLVLLGTPDQERDSLWEIKVNIALGRITAVLKRYFLDDKLMHLDPAKMKKFFMENGLKSLIEADSRPFILNNPRGILEFSMPDLFDPQFNTAKNFMELFSRDFAMATKEDGGDKVLYEAMTIKDQLVMFWQRKLGVDQELLINQELKMAGIKYGKFNHGFEFGLNGFKPGEIGIGIGLASQNHEEDQIYIRWESDNAVKFIRRNAQGQLIKEAIWERREYVWENRLSREMKSKTDEFKTQWQEFWDRSNLRSEIFIDTFLGQSLKDGLFNAAFRFIGKKEFNPEKNSIGIGQGDLTDKVLMKWRNNDVVFIRLDKDGNEIDSSTWIEDSQGDWFNQKYFGLKLFWGPEKKSIYLKEILGKNFIRGLFNKGFYFQDNNFHPGETPIGVGEGGLGDILMRWVDEKTIQFVRFDDNERIVKMSYWKKEVDKWFRYDKKGDVTFELGEQGRLGKFGYDYVLKDGFIPGNIDIGIGAFDPSIKNEVILRIDDGPFIIFVRKSRYFERFAYWARKNGHWQQVDLEYYAFWAGFSNKLILPLAQFDVRGMRMNSIPNMSEILDGLKDDRVLMEWIGKYLRITRLNQKDERIISVNLFQQNETWKFQSRFVHLQDVKVYTEFQNKVISEIYMRLFNGGKDIGSIKYQIKDPYVIKLFNQRLIKRDGGIQSILVEYGNDYAKWRVEFDWDGNKMKAKKIKIDLAMKSTGGIDLTSDKALDVKLENGSPIQNLPAGRQAFGDDRGMQFKINPATLKEWQDSPGITPVIINIQPIENLPQYLGIT